MGPTEWLPSGCLPACLLACLPFCLPASLPACLPACLLACLPACLLACLLAEVIIFRKNPFQGLVSGSRSLKYQGLDP